MGKPRSYQVVEDKILIEDPSSIILLWMSIDENTWKIIWKGTHEGRWGATRWFQSKEMTSELGGGTIEGMPPWPKKLELEKKTGVVLISLSKGRVGLIEYFLNSTTST